MAVNTRNSEFSHLFSLSYGNYTLLNLSARYAHLQRLFIESLLE